MNQVRIFTFAINWGSAIAFLNAHALPAADEVHAQAASHMRAATATALLDISHNGYRFYYDPRKWQKTDSDNVQSGTSDDNGDAFNDIGTNAPADVTNFESGRGHSLIDAQVTSSRFPKLSLDQLAHNFKTSWMESLGPDARIEMDAARLVNGYQVAAVRMKGTLEGHAVVVFGYCAATKAGTVVVETKIAADHFAERQAEITEFLDGLSPGASAS